MIDDPAIERQALFHFEQTGEDSFRVQPFPSSLLRSYGGQIVSQALGVAQRTMPPDRFVNSCHSYFLHPGAIDRPIDFRVTRDRDGRSFSSRRVVAEQDGETVLTFAASFHTPEKGGEHQLPMPAGLAAPEDTRSVHDYIRDLGETLPVRHRPFWWREGLVDWRPLQPFVVFARSPQPAVRQFWFRLRMRLGDDLAEHQRFLAYATDIQILHTGLGPLGIGWGDDHLQASSLDHSIWFHAPFRADEWLLYALDSPVAYGARTLGRGTVFTQAGQLIATVAQEGLIRMLDAPRLDAL